MKSGNLEVLHSTIVNQINVFLQERGIGIPDQWTTYELIKEHVINDETLNRYDMNELMEAVVPFLQLILECLVCFFLYYFFLFIILFILDKCRDSVCHRFQWLVLNLNRETFSGNVKQKFFHLTLYFSKPLFRFLFCYFYVFICIQFLGGGFDPTSWDFFCISHCQGSDEQPIEAYPYTDTQIIGGDSVSAIQQRILIKYGAGPCPSAEILGITRLEAQDSFEVKVKIILKMDQWDPTGDWMRRGARALDNPRTASGEESLERLYALWADLDDTGPLSESFEKLQNKIPRRNPSPLDQFLIVPFLPMKIGKLYFSFTNASFFLLLTLSFVLFLFHLVTQKGGGKSVPNACQSLLELIYDFVLNLVNEQIGGLSGNVKQKFFPCISVTFTFSLFRNLQGMIPYSFTVTSHFLVTLGLSFSLFIGITIVGFSKNGLHFLSFSLPAGVPLPLAPFLVLLELIPHCFRALSLGIRLFANMMAGHSLVKILSGFAWTMLCMNDLFYFIGSTGPFFIVLALTGLELGVAILQAYVFTILICIYLNDAINLH